MGNGHTTTAQAIADKLAQSTSCDSVIVYDMCSLGSFIMLTKRFHRWFLRFLPVIYNLVYRWGDYSYCPGVLAWLLRLSQKKFFQIIQQAAPDVIIMTHPYAGIMCSRLKRTGKLSVPLVVVATDFTAHQIWVNEGIDYYWVMNEQTAQSFYQHGAPGQSIYDGGIPLRGQFAQKGRPRQEVLATLGLPHDRLTVLIFHWAASVKLIDQLLGSLTPYADAISCIVVCGRNEVMQAHLSSQSFTFPIKILGFINYMHDLMNASDFMVSKAGGLTVAESLAVGLPLAIINPVYGPESGNELFLQEHSAGFTIAKPSDLADVVAQLLDEPTLLATHKRRMQELAKPHALDDFVEFIAHHPLKQVCVGKSCGCCHACSPA